MSKAKEKLNSKDPLRTYKSKRKEIAKHEYDPTKYGFQNELTDELDKIYKSKAKIGQETINEIVLWKTNRYVKLTPEVAKALNNPELRNKTFDLERTQRVLELLLAQNGIRMPMASTILRFINPSVYQIIDQRAYRFVFGREYKSSTKTSAEIENYMEYLERLQEVIKERPQWKFEDLDRILYLLDKEHNKKHKIKT